MKVSGKREKWAAAILGVICLALLINLLRSPFVRARAPHLVGPVASSPSGERGTATGSFADLSRYDPEVRLDLLNQLSARPLPASERDPFRYGLSPAEKAQKEQAAEQAAVKASQPPPPPPPPPITVKALGYVDGPGGVREAFFADEEDTYRVREGQSFANRYKVLKITPTMVTIDDQASHQPVALQFPE